MLSKRKIRILCVDGPPLFREGIAAVINIGDGMLLIGNASNGRGAIGLFKNCRQDSTLMDLRMPEMHGIDTMFAIREQFANARIILLTTYTGDCLARRAFRAGATGFLSKNALRRELLEAIRTVHFGQRKTPRKLPRRWQTPIPRTH